LVGTSGGILPKAIRSLRKSNSFVEKVPDMALLLIWNVSLRVST